MVEVMGQTMRWSSEVVLAVRRTPVSAERYRHRFACFSSDCWVTRGHPIFVPSVAAALALQRQLLLSSPAAACSRSSASSGLCDADLGDRLSPALKQRLPCWVMPFQLFPPALSAKSLGMSHEEWAHRFLPLVDLDLECEPHVLNLVLSGSGRTVISCTDRDASSLLLCSTLGCACALSDV